MKEGENEAEMEKEEDEEEEEGKEKKKEGDGEKRNKKNKEEDREEEKEEEKEEEGGRFSSVTIKGAVVILFVTTHFLQLNTFTITSGTANDKNLIKKYIVQECVSKVKREFASQSL